MEQIFYDKAILNKKKGIIVLDTKQTRWHPYEDFEEYNVTDICIENYDEYIFLYYKQYHYHNFYFDTPIENVENLSDFCEDQIKTYWKEHWFKPAEKITYLPSGWLRLKKITEHVIKIYNKNLIVIS